MQHKVIDTKDVVIRFAGDSGDGMQLTGSLFADMSAIFGNELSTFPDYPAEIRAPHGTVSGVSGFQVHIGSEHITTPGDFCDLLVAMNPAALKANAKWLKRTAMVLIDSDTFDEDGLKRASRTAGLTRRPSTSARTCSPSEWHVTSTTVRWSISSNILNVSSARRSRNL